jgi:hypothetical protein
MKELFVILLALTLLFLGCVGEKTVEEKTATTTTLLSPSTDYAFENADIPLIGENETVEIGEML